MTLKIKLPHVIENEKDFDLVKSYFKLNGTSYDKPEKYPVALLTVDYQYYDDYVDENTLYFIYPEDIKNIFNQSENFKKQVLEG